VAEAPTISDAHTPELPTLSTPTIATAPPAGAPTPPTAPAANADLATREPAPVVDPDAPNLPMPVPAAMPNVVADSSDVTDEAAAGGSVEHPMAHLMPQNSSGNEASRRAAEIRAAQKAKAKKIKIGVAIGTLVFCAVVGPPLGKWFVNAINEAGNTSTEQTG
jgi:hypothetical protein